MDARIVAPADLTVGEVGLWRELQAACRDLDSPFLSPEFTQAVAQARRDARVAVLSSGRRTVGFLPFHAHSSGVAKPIGGPIADYQGPVLAPDVACGGAELLAACGLSAYDFNHAPLSMSALAGGAVHRSQSLVMDFSAGFSAYVAGRPKAARHAIKETERRVRRLTEDLGPVRFELHDASEAAWPWLVEMREAGYARLGVASGFRVPWVARTLDALRRMQSREFAGVLSTVRAGDRLIAAQFGMRTRTTLCWWFNTYDFALRNRAPGIVLLLMAAEHVAGRGVGRIDFGRGSEDYKLTFATGATELCEGSIELPRTVPGRLRQLQKLGVRAFAHVPLGRFESWPRRALSRLVTGVRLPAEPTSPGALQG